MDKDDARRTIAALSWMYVRRKTNISGCTGKESASLVGQLSGGIVMYLDKSSQSVVVKSFSVPFYIDFGSESNIIRMERLSDSEGLATYKSENFKFSISGDSVRFETGEEYRLF